MNIQAPTLTASRSVVLLPIVFILLWSSGYIVGKIGVQYADPFTLIFIRFSSAAFILFLVAIITKAPWPKSWQQFGHIAIVGVLIQALQFGGVYSGLNEGINAGVSALIVGSMPIFAALGSGWLLREKVSAKQWQGLFIGLIGVAMVISHKLTIDNQASVSGYLYTFMALLGITAGTLYQKRFCSDMDLRTGGVIQLGVAAILMYILAWKNEPLVVNWNMEIFLSVAWLTLVNSIAAISILFVLIRQGEASRVASLFYLIPPTTALMGWLLLGEAMNIMVISGLVVVSFGVYLSTKK